MLAPSRNQRAEVKYNVTTEFPHLGLHSAAASGDIGLVKYALTHGQPVNSVLDGVLPLHAACAGGKDLVVKLLIDHGADVNAPRLPRKYSDRNRDTTAPIVGTSGSTPLHFASANGHLTVVRMLLLHGAHADRSDKHGITPELIARQNGWIECADDLRDWQMNKDRDLRERSEFTPPDNGDGSSRERSGSHSTIENLETSLRKRLHLKRSVDHALNCLRSNSSNTSGNVNESKPPTFRTSSSDQEVPQTQPFPDTSGRRPSLPSIYAEPPQARLSAPPRTRRPRSAGTGAEAIPPRKLGSKISLLNLFKRSGGDGSSSSVTSGSELPLHSPPSPIPIPGATSPAARSVNLPASPRSVTLPLSSPPHESGSFLQRRMASNSSMRSYLPVATDSNTHNELSKENLRGRSSSGASATSSNPPNANANELLPEAPVRPGILRMHNRSSSSGQGSSGYSSSRLIRFEASSSTTSLTGRARSPSLRTPAQPESRLRTVSTSSTGIAAYTIEESPITTLSMSMPPIIVDPADDDPDEEEEYGVPIDRSRAMDDASSSSCLASSEVSPVEHPPLDSLFPFSIDRPPPMDDGVLGRLQPSEGRLRGESVSSTSTDSNPPQSSSSDATWTSSGSVPTPNTPHLALPSLSHHPYTAPSILTIPESPHSPHSPGLSSRRPHIPTPIDIGIDLHSISSHAQAEALVQRTEQSILNMDMEQYLLEAQPKQEAGVGMGRSPLSAKLAAYGESLAIERRLKEEAEAGMNYGKSRAMSVSSGTDDRGALGIGVAKMRAQRDKMSVRMASGSSDESGSSSESTSLGAHTRVVRTTRSVSNDMPRMQRSTPRASQMRGLPFTSAYSPPPVRSYTPDPESELSRPIGIPLSRISTAPAHNADSIEPTTPERTTRRGRDPSRHVVSANKLTRMGFATLDGWQPSSLGAHPPPSHSRAHKSRSPSGKSRFGIRTIMQSFRGSEG